MGGGNGRKGISQSWQACVGGRGGGAVDDGESEEGDGESVSVACNEPDGESESREEPEGEMT